MGHLSVKVIREQRTPCPRAAPAPVTRVTRPAGGPTYNLPLSSSAPSRSRLRLPALYALVVLAIFALTRVGLALWTGLDAVPLADWPAIFAKGLWFDLAVLAALLAPVWLYEALLPDRVRATRIHQGLRFAWFALAVFALLFGALAEVTFWREFSTRFNFIAIDYLIYTRK